jgi:hypothetical protein
LIATPAPDRPPPKTTVEYVGFRNTDLRREFHLRTHAGPVSRDFVVGIRHESFTAGRARLQDGPEICYEKLRRELEASGDQPETNDFTVSDEELAAFRASHAPPPRGRPKAVARTPPTQG